MTYENSEEHEEELRRDAVSGAAREGAAHDDEFLRVLLTEVAPEFPVTSALGDRALAGAVRRRARTRTFGGAGALVALAVGALAVAPLAGWGGHGSGAVGATPALGALVASSSATAPSSPVSSSSASGPVSPPSATVTLTIPPPSNVPAWNSPKMKALDRVMNALQSGHGNSYMGVGLTGQSFTTGSYTAGAGTDASPIIVFRKPVSDPTLEHVAIQAAAPYAVVFHDTVLNSSEQWYLGHRLGQDTDYWKAQGVVFGTALQMNGTITIFTSDPAKVVPLLEQHYGYDGRVFVGEKWPPAGS